MSKKYVQHKRLISRIGVLVLLLALLPLVFPVTASAEVFTYQDYISDIYVDGDTQIVELVFDDSFAENVWFALYSYEDESYIRADCGPFEFYAGSFEDDSQSVYDIRFGLFGEDSILSTYGIPDGTMFEFSFVIDGVDPVVGGTYAGIDGYPHGYVNYYSADTDGEYVSQELKSLDAGFVLGDYIPSVRFSFFGSFGLNYTDEFGRSAKYDGISFFAGINKLTFKYDGDYSILCEDIKMTMTIEKFLDSELSNSDILMGQMRDQLTLQGKKLDEVTGELSDLNDKVDDLGGKVDDLINGSPDQQDKVNGAISDMGSAGDKINSGLSDIDDFQSQYMGQLDDNLDNLVNSVNIQLLAAPLNFVQKYCNKIVAVIPSSYLIVFTLPMLLGILMFILGRSVHIPRPDVSGDEITREMTTRTEVLQGRHAGSVTVTRTTTTSSVTGVNHKE